MAGHPGVAARRRVAVVTGLRAGSGSAWLSVFAAEGTHVVMADDGPHVTPLRARGMYQGPFLASLCGYGAGVRPRACERR
jgi:NAD(P)-dependent dehydrogenase (short-subunit alcohol dehydrogenase family)